MERRSGSSVVTFAICLLVSLPVAAKEAHPVLAHLRRAFPSVAIDAAATFTEEQAFVGRRLVSGRRAHAGDDRLNLLYPTSYDGELVAELGTQRVVLRALGAAAAQVTQTDGKLVYERAYPSVDVVQLPLEERSEELLLLHDERAPLVYEYEIVALEDVAAIVMDDGAIRFVPPLTDEAKPSEQGGPIRFTLLYDPVTETFSRPGVLVADRAFHTATLLPGGQVLIAADWKSTGFLRCASCAGIAGRQPAIAAGQRPALR